MTSDSLTIDPEDVRRLDGSRSDWREAVTAYVQRAAAVGESVVLTTRRRTLTPEQVANALGVSRSTISRKIKTGELHAEKVGNRNRITLEEFERFWRVTMGDLVELTRDELRGELLP